MILYIDTTDFNKVTFALSADGKLIKRSYKIDPHRSHETLQKLEEFIKSRKLKVESIKEIICNKGPGSFTGTRVGVTHALALGFALDVSVKFESAENFNLLSAGKQKL